MHVSPTQLERIRHRRKYAGGDMRYHSFYFRGPGARHNLRAQNLNIFCQIAAGIDEDTWLYHLRRGDYSCWLREAIKDAALADRVRTIETRHDLEPETARELVCREIELVYTLPE
jgi:hypothetical protein